MGRETKVVTVERHKGSVSSKDDITNLFQSLKIDESWTFDNTPRKDTSYVTHSYYRYPAKFIPQLANRLIREYAPHENDLVCDPFMGCGTTLVEAMLLKRPSIGVDINPSAYIATKAKTTPIKPEYLQSKVDILYKKAKSVLKDKEAVLHCPVKPKIPPFKRIDYWFTEKTKTDLGLLLALIDDEFNEDVRSFLRCGFAHVLKNCSKWLMLSVKPTIDKKKEIPDVFDTFFAHTKRMVNKNEQFWNLLQPEVRENYKSFVRVELQDCRNLPLDDGEVKAIVTSSPYVTSYEYADLHQLTALWFEYAGTVDKLRKGFIGSAQPKDLKEELKSEIAKSIVQEFEDKGINGGVAKEVKTYFAEMQQAFREFNRVLSPDGGTACFVIGNTNLKGVDILNAEVFLETCLNLNYKLVKVVKRRIPRGGKILPSTRDPTTGRFTASDNNNLVEAYTVEYIVIVEKEGEC